MKIEHMMSRKVIAVDNITPLDEIAKIMKEDDIGFLPIIKKNKIIGVITDRDIVTRIIANNDNTLKDYFTKDILSIDYQKDVLDALKLMRENKVKRLLVTKGKKVIGVISLADILENIDDEEVLKTIKTIWTIYRNVDKYVTEIDEFEL